MVAQRAEQAERLLAVLERVRRIEVKTRRLVQGLFVGQYRSAFKGRGLDFAEVREYDETDDVRLIDWNVTARTGVLHVRQYEEERELTTLLALDVSPSAAFGTVNQLKADLAVELAAIIAFCATTSNDRVGALLFTDRIELFVPPRKGRRHAFRLLRDVLNCQPQGRGTRLVAALEFLNDVLKRRAVVFLVSDFLDEGFEHELRVANVRHDLIAVELSDPREFALPDVGLVELCAAEGRERRLVDTSDPRVREEFAQRAAEERRRRLALLRSLGVEVLSLSTAEPLAPPLVRFFRERERRRAR